MKTTATFYVLFSISLSGYAQTSDTQYAMPLSDVIKDIEERYEITIRDPENLISGKTVTYAQWRYRVVVEQTLSNVLAPVDLVAQKEGDKKYKLKKYQYHRTTVEEGKEKLEYLSGLYHDQASWENRKAELRTCMLKALQLDPLPESPGSKPFITNKRKMNGYTIENIAIETLPGLYVCGSIYKPSLIKGKVPIILSPNGHIPIGRYHEAVQVRCAMLARMGAIVINYDLFAYGESLLQFKPEDHRRSLASSIQALNSIRILDYLTSLPEADVERIGITGASGGGSQTMLITALDDRIKVSVPVVMLSCYFYGGCPCESGMPVHLCGKGTNNVEMAAMASPRPQLVISDGGDWSDHVPVIEYPYLKTIYSYYGKVGNVENAHFPDEGHDYGISKRTAAYRFLAKHLGLDVRVVLNKAGEFDESTCTTEDKEAMLVFGKGGELLPGNAIKSFDELQKVFNEALGSTSHTE
ncbi:MAG: acetylxylan esterase [Bacteroidales bacterium]|nr:acetylxylan esterase [Bacteroidales bacterium]